jgi:hypothetical protein
MPPTTGSMKQSNTHTGPSNPRYRDPKKFKPTAVEVSQPRRGWGGGEPLGDLLAC